MREWRESQAKNQTQRDELIRDSNFQNLNETKGSNLFQADFGMNSVNTYNYDKNAFFPDSLDQNAQSYYPTSNQFKIKKSEPRNLKDPFSKIQTYGSPSIRKS